MPTDANPITYETRSPEQLLEHEEDLQFLSPHERTEVLRLLPLLAKGHAVEIASETVRDGLGTLLAMQIHQRAGLRLLTGRLDDVRIVAPFESAWTSPAAWEKCLVELGSTLTPYHGLTPASFRKAMASIILADENTEHLILYSRFPSLEGRPTIWAAARKLRSAILEMRRVVAANPDAKRDLVQPFENGERKLVKAFLNATIMSDGERSKRSRKPEQATRQRLTNSVRDVLGAHHPQVTSGELDARAAFITEVVLADGPDPFDGKAATPEDVERDRKMMSARARRHPQPSE